MFLHRGNSEANAVEVTQETATGEASGGSGGGSPATPHIRFAEKEKDVDGDGAENLNLSRGRRSRRTAVLSSGTGRQSTEGRARTVKAKANNLDANSRVEISASHDLSLEDAADSEEEVLPRKLNARRKSVRTEVSAKVDTTGRSRSREIRSVESEAVPVRGRPRRPSSESDVCSLDDMLAQTEGIREEPVRGDTSRDLEKEDGTENTTVLTLSSRRFVRQKKGSSAGKKGSAAKGETRQRRSRRKKGDGKGVK